MSTRARKERKRAGIKFTSRAEILAGIVIRGA